MPGQHKPKTVDPNTVKRPVLIVDAVNLFIRCYVAYPQMSTVDGHQMGGVVGFMKKLKFLSEELQPRSIIVVWESGGSSKRRKLYSEYKRGRRPAKMNRFYEDDLPDSDENRVHQTLSLVEFLKLSPVCQVYVNDCEADDVIAYLCKGKYRNDEKVIVSSDKDMYQLLDERTMQYSLDKKKVITMEDVYSEFHVMPWNFALAKTICGDVSDNIPGVKGVGFKTAVNKVPMLATHQDIILQDVIDYCNSHRDDSPVLKRITESIPQLKMNWRLVNLGSSSLTPGQARKIDSTIDKFRPSASKVAFIQSLIKEGIQTFDVDSYLYSFSCIDGYSLSAR